MERDRDRGAGGVLQGMQDQQQERGLGRGEEGREGGQRHRPAQAGQGDGIRERLVTLAVGSKAASVGISFPPLPLSPPHPSPR